MSKNYKKHMSEKLDLLHVWMLSKDTRQHYYPNVYLESINPLNSYCYAKFNGIV